MMGERKRDALTRAVAGSWTGKGHSIMADNWPGVLISGDGWRVILTRDACRYRLQQRRQGATRWEPVIGPESPGEWASFPAVLFPDLAEKVGQLPQDPKDALPAVAARLAVPVPEARRVRYWSAPDYSGVLAQQGNLRAVRDRTGRNYAVQWAAPADFEAGKPLHWITQHKGPNWPALVDLMARKTVSRNEPRKDRAEIRAELNALFEGFPDNAADGSWPVVKVHLPRPRAKR